MGRKSILTPELHQRIVAYISSGSFAWVAAQACGVSTTTFTRWMNSGKKDPDSPYRALWADVETARCKARVVAENAVFRDKPEVWLRLGPGRERPGEPGWTESHEVTGAEGGPLEVHVIYHREG